MLNAAEFAELLDLVYTGAENPDVWGEFLDRSAMYLGARSCSLTLLDPATVRVDLSVTARIDPKLAIEMGEWGPRDIWVQNFDAHFLNRPGVVVASQEVLPDEVVLKSAYYNEDLVRIGVSQTMGSVLFYDPHTVSALNYYYPREAGLRTPDQMELLRRLMPHVQRALRLLQRLGRVERSESALTESLDRLGSGFALMDEHGRLLRMNRAAETMMQRQDGLRQRNGRLAAAISQEAALLQALVRAAALTTVRAGVSSGGVVRVTRPSGKASYVVTIMPISPHGQLFDLRKARVVALITDPAAVPVPDAVVLRELFGFTAAESEVARLLMQGQDRQEIADRLSVSLNTVRAHLRNLFSKTATPSQAKLVQLLLVATRTVPDLT